MGDNNNGGRIYFNVPFSQKDEAKSYGARWDPEKVLWYAPDSVVADLMKQSWPLSAMRGSRVGGSQPAYASPTQAPANPFGNDSGRVFYQVPFKEKDDAKALGARWCADKVMWYAPDASIAHELQRRWPRVGASRSRDRAPGPASQRSPSSQGAHASAPATPNDEYAQFLYKARFRKYFAVPFEQKDEIKALGARFDWYAKLWFADVDDEHVWNVASQRWPIVNTSPIMLPREDRAFGGNQLYIDLTPDTAWGRNVRSMVAPTDWERLRLHVHSRVRHHCETCRVNTRDPKTETRLNTLMRFDYNGHTGVQTLKRLMAVCKECHEVAHFGLAELTGQGADAMEHLMKVNKWSRARAESHRAQAFALWHDRNDQPWSCDISIFNDAGICTLHAGGH